MYFYTLSQWLQYFPRDQFLIIRTEDLKENEAVVAAEMYNFIGAGTFRGKTLEKEEQTIQTEKGLTLETLGVCSFVYLISVPPTTGSLPHLSFFPLSVLFLLFIHFYLLFLICI